MKITAAVDDLCDRFEAAWQAGQRPRLERYLAKVPRVNREAVLEELLGLELHYRVRQGDVPRLREYLRRFPRDAARIESIWASAVSGAEPADTELLDRTRRIDPSAAPTRHPPTVSPHLRTLEQTWPFSELPRTVLLSLLHYMHEEELPRGTVLMRQGEPGRQLFVLLRGSAQVVLDDGRQCHELSEITGRAVIGEMSLLTSEPCTATVTATSPIRVLTLPAERFYELARHFPVLGTLLGQVVARRLGFMPLDSLTGKTLHGYNILRCVGRGGMAVVYEAIHRATGRRVAMKMLSHRFAHDLEPQRRFQREMKIYRRLRHRGIPRLLDHFSAFGTNFMVLEFFEGTTLDQRIRPRRGLSERRVRKIVRRLARVLAYVHRQGVCHRDLKPANVILGPRGSVRLIDFGLARGRHDASLTGRDELLGTPRYMPPEQLAGKAVDRRADLFAFGCVVYEMLTGEPLFGAGDFLSILDRQRAWSLPPADAIRPGLSQDLYRILQESLADRPEERTLDLRRLAIANRR